MSIYDDIFKPSTFDEYIGQEKAKAIIQVMMDASEREERYYPNFLLTGSAGLGKTSLGRLIYDGLPYDFIDGAALNKEKIPELRGFYLVDEIHNLKPKNCDSMNVLIDNEKVIVVGCTTNPGELPGPFRSRFQVINLVPYTEQELVQIMRGVLNRKETLEIADEHLVEIAKRGRETPRTILKYLSFVMDMMVTQDVKVLTSELLEQSFQMLGIDEKGLSDIDRLYLEAFPTDGRAVGIDYLSAVLSLDKETIEEEVEPFLLHRGLIDRTRTGRVRIMDENAEMENLLDLMFERARA